ncbi:pirin family protein [Motiliproteus sediminis]|uniref:pirin family protein n=1 Tax=Motiliproteus sediminis TaxID=1468178 RepID=UPI001AEF5BC4|nr:pirin family protein [Motiliproteus sediminis]
MITPYPSAQRGYADHGWLQSYHRFSFADYYDPEQMGISVLRVINDDRVMPGAGFGAHPHRDMEIVSYVLEGAIEHRDSMGNTSRLNAGEVQVMSAGSGIVHSEYNPSTDTPLHFLQIWIQPDRAGYPPRYQQGDFSHLEGLNLVVGNDTDAPLSLRQDARIWQLRINDLSLDWVPKPDRQYYLHLARGELDLNGQSLSAGDGATIGNEPSLRLQTPTSAEGLLFELPR